MATYTAVAAGGNWSAAATWGGGGYPVAGDTANIDATMTGTVTVDVDSACAVLNLTGNGGTLAFGNFKITVTGGVTLGGTITAGTGGLVLTGSQTLTSGGITFPGYLKLSAAGTYVLSGNAVTTGSFTVDTGNAVLDQTTTETLTVNGSVTINKTLTGTATIVMGGTGSLSAGDNNNPRLGLTLKINTSGTVTCVDVSLTSSGALVYIAGTFVTTGSQLSCSGACTVTLPGIAWSGSLFFSNTTITLGAAFVHTGNVTTILSNTTFVGAYNVTLNNLENYGGTMIMPSGQTLTVTGWWRVSWYSYSGTIWGRTIRSSVASSPAYIVYSGTMANCKLMGVTFTDIDATGSTDEILTWHGTTTRCVNVTAITDASFTDPGAANVKTGSDYTYRGVAQTASYPTTATTQAADQATLEAQKAYLQRPADGGPAQIQFGSSTPTVGTLNTAAIYSAGEAAQLAVDIAEVNGHKAEIKKGAVVLTGADAGEYPAFIGSFQI